VTAPAKQPQLIAIVAMASNRVIGRDGKLPWHLPEDLKFFKRTTLGHPILMGRKTFDSIGKPLPGRKNIVLSRTMQPREGVEVIRDVSELPSVCGDAEKIFLIGGAQLFADLLPQCAGLYLTWIEHEYEGDVMLPPFEHLFVIEDILGGGDGFEFRYYGRAAGA
jgi:dihydrofolate reductase